MINLDNIYAPIQEIEAVSGVSLFIKREDLNHHEIMGNKLRKLKYNLIRAKELNFSSLLSFGGAYSNHILALSAAGRIYGFKTIGIIRGEELKNKELNFVLSQAKQNGMEFYFVSREEYKRKNEAEFIEKLRNKFENSYIVPEGGSNDLAIKGAAEIVFDIDEHYDVIACACGTGGTVAGIIKGIYERDLFDAKIIGFPVLKGGEFIVDEIKRFLPKEVYSKVNWEINSNYHFGGYGKTKPELIEFIRRFKNKNNINLDYIYTGKMMYGIYDLVKSNKLGKAKKILVIHTGGTQTAIVK